MIDGDLTLFESMAINLYLAKKYNKDGMWPSSLDDQARAYQWSFWAMTEIEKLLLTILVDMFMTPRTAAIPRRCRGAEGSLQAVQSAQRRAAGPRLSAGRKLHRGRPQCRIGVHLGPADQVDFAPYPNVGSWLERCLSRPAFKAARGGK